MPTEPPDPELTRKQRIADLLNRHGYSFQNAVIAKVEEARGHRRSKWAFEVAEFPVEVNGHGTRIDFILWTHQSSIMLVCECKRVYTENAEWYFASTPHVRRGHQERFIAEVLQRPEGSRMATGAFAVQGLPNAPYCHQGFEVLLNPTSNNFGNVQTVEDAVGQVVKGINGLTERLAVSEEGLPQSRSRVLIPVIFTTAKLWVDDADLTHADVVRGRVDASSLSPREVPYVYYQYPQSPGLKHSQPRQAEGLADSGLSPMLARDSLRTVAIVNSASITQFLERFVAEAVIVTPVVF